MTRLKYDEIDRQIREQLRKGMIEYQQNADTRRTEIIHDRAVALNNQNKTLKRFKTKSRTKNNQ